MMQLKNEIERPATLVSTMKKISCQIHFDFGQSGVVPILYHFRRGAIKIIDDFLESSVHVENFYIWSPLKELIVTHWTFEYT